MWIYKFLKINTKLKISKQPIGQGRFNIIAQKGQKTGILVTGHIDTVQPNLGWSRSSTEPKIVDDKLYGRGSSDMKCGIAIMLNICSMSTLKDNTAFLFYCDEEYDFLGMKKFIELYTPLKGNPCKVPPKLIISLDGDGLEVGNSCRGLIEMKVAVEGKAGHSANPKSGVNAITESFRVIEKLNAKLIKDFIVESSEEFGLKIDEIKIRHDLGSWITPKDKLKNIISLAPKEKLKNAKKSGYIDIQMLWEAFGKVPTFSLGAGEPGQAHKANEYVKISNVLTAQKFYERLLTNNRSLT